MEALIDEADFEWLMIDASHIKVYLLGGIVISLERLIYKKWGTVSG